MARHLNLVIIEGNLGRDPEMRYTPSGQPVTQFSVAVNRPRKRDDGGWDEDTTWFRVTAWGQTAERAAETLRKGELCRVQGRIATREYEDRDGAKKQAWEVVADRVDSLASKADREAREGREPVAARSGGNGSAPERGDLDDLPF